MPRLSLWFRSFAMVYLLSGAAAGAVLMLSRAAGVSSARAWLLPLHIEFMLAGWAVQLAMGVAYWILPRLRTGASRGNPLLAWMAFALFNVGVLSSAVGGEVESSWNLAILGHVAEAAGVAVFVYGAWRRLPPSLAPSGRSLPIIG